MRGADAVVTICEALRRELEPRVPNKSRVSVVENGVDVQQFSLGSHHAGRAADTSATGGVMAYVGTFQPYEGLDILVRSLPAIIAARPDVQLLIVGAAAGDNHDVERGLRALIGALGVERHVTFTGRLPHADVAGIYARADIVVYPRLLTRTTALTTPLKPLEAMAMGCAVVGSDVPAMTEIVRHDETGLTFPAGQPEALASVCLALLAQPRAATRPWRDRREPGWSRSGNGAAWSKSTRRSTPPSSKPPVFRTLFPPEEAHANHVRCRRTTKLHEDCSAADGGARRQV